MSAILPFLAQVGTSLASNLLDKGIKYGSRFLNENKASMGDKLLKGRAQLHLKEIKNNLEQALAIIDKDQKLLEEMEIE